MHAAALTGRRVIVAAASVLTVLSVLSLDIVAGTGPTHTTGLGVLAVVVGGARIALVGRHRGLFATLSAALMAQPAVHALGEGFDPALAHAHAATPSFGHAWVTDVVAAAIHLVLAGLVIVGVGTIEWLLELVALTLARALTFLLLAARSTSRRFIAGPAIPVTRRPVPSSGVWIDYPTRRGPPRRSLPALA